MLNIGDQLYQLTLRDQTTSYIDPFFRALAPISLGVGVSTGTTSLNIPPDRALWLHSLIFSGAAEAATQWNAFTLGLVQAGIQVTTIVAKGLSSTLASAYTETYLMGNGLVIPPQTSALNFNLSRAGTTGAVNATFTAIGYLIPPGRINRL